MDPSGGSLTLDEFCELYEHDSDSLWREAAATTTPGPGLIPPLGVGGQAMMRAVLRWDAASVGGASKKELLLALREAAPKAWLRERKLSGKLRPVLKRTSSAALQAAYLALLRDGGAAEPEPEPEPETETEPETEPGRETEQQPAPADGAGAGSGDSPAAAGALSRDEVQALAEVGGVPVTISGSAVHTKVRGTLRRSQGRRNGKVLTEDGELVWFAFADVESGALCVCRG